MRTSILVFVFVLFFGIIGIRPAVAQNYDHTEKTFSQLPKTAQSFIKKHFSYTPVASVSGNNEVNIVVFEDESRVVFDFFGEWTDIACYNKNGVPQKIVPRKILKFLETSVMGGHYIVQIDRSIEGINIDLENSIEFSFTMKGQVKY